MLKKITNEFTIALAIIAAVTATGFIAGYKMQAFVSIYWCTVTMKYVCDIIATHHNKG